MKLLFSLVSAFIVNAISTILLKQPVSYIDNCLLVLLFYIVFSQDKD